jgi:hypothetical protein
MKNQRCKARLGMLLLAAGATFVAACAMDPDGDKKTRSEQSELATDEPTPNESVATEKTVYAKDGEDAAGATASAPDGAEGNAVTPRVSCRRVTASSIPVFSTPSGSGVLCRFFAGDRFSHFGFVSPPGRYITWCPRGVPPAQGTTGYAQAAGTVDGGCG